jgi:hypothetical protein
MPQTDPTQDAAEMEAITEIAWRHLRCPTFQVANLDRLDFRDCHVLAIRDALSAAYRAGRESVKGGGQ